MKCTKCGCFASELLLVIDPKKPRFAKKKDFVIEKLCESCAGASW